MLDNFLLDEVKTCVNRDVVVVNKAQNMMSGVWHPNTTSIWKKAGGYNSRNGEVNSSNESVYYQDKQSFQTFSEGYEIWEAPEDGWRVGRTEIGD